METATPTTYEFKRKATEAFSGAKQRYLDDLNALSEESLVTSPGGCARTPADFTYEIVVINRRITKRLLGEDPGPFEFKQWMTAPDEFKNKQTILSEFEGTCTDVENALAAIPDDEMLRRIQLPKEYTTPYDLVTFCASHIGYHD